MNSEIVIKLGGSILNSFNDVTLKKFLRTLVRYLNQRPAIILHGGGLIINQYLRRLDIVPRFIRGLRYTDQNTLNVVRFVLNGLVNPHLTFLLNQVGLKAIGISGETGLVTARRRKNLGYVGEPVEINLDLLKEIQKAGFAPVISCLGRDRSGNVLNINADTLSQFIAEELSAEQLILFTDVSGVLDNDKKTIAELRLKEIPGLIRKKVITGGMIPKVFAARKAIVSGVKSVVIASARFGFQKNHYTVIRK